MDHTPNRGGGALEIPFTCDSRLPQAGSPAPGPKHAWLPFVTMACALPEDGLGGGGSSKLDLQQEGLKPL